MRVFSAGSIVVFATGLAMGYGLQFGKPAQEHKYIPKPGDTAVIYTHKFSHEHWAAAKKEFTSHLRKQVDADHQHLRDSFILESPERGEIVGVTLWRSPEDLAKWDHDPKRIANMKSLDKFAREPISEARYTILDEVIEQQ